jgi:hypothetical protein
MKIKLNWGIIVFLLLLLLGGCATDQENGNPEGQKDMSKEAWDSPSRQHIPR